MARERVTESFAEGHARIELVADAVRAADVVGAREVVLDVVAEFVRDHVLVEFVGVGRDIGGEHDVLRRRAGEESVSSATVLSAAQSTTRAGKLVLGAAPEHQLESLVDSVEDGERRRGARAGDGAGGGVLKPDGISTSCAPVPALKVTAIGVGVDRAR